LLVGVATANANGGVLQLKSGITFPATQVAATDANTLDDYEEGTWTPSFLAVSGSATYTTQNGTYTKIGRQVTVEFYIDVNVSSSLIAERITGLPFTASSTAQFGAATFTAYDVGAYGGQCNILGLVVPNTTDIQLRKTASATSAPTLTNTSITNGTAVAGACTYFV
jgi:hypothetical protein